MTDDILRRVLFGAILFFPFSEISLAMMKRSRGGEAQSEDRGSMRLLWLCVAAGMAMAVAAQWVAPARIAAPRSAVASVALVLLVGGLALRWAAILTPGRLFTVDVAIHSDHAVVQRGLYRYMRHPSYTGLLVAFVGLGAYFGNWLSILGLLAPVTLGVLHRVATEERALHRSLGPAYADYCGKTKRFLPGLL